MKVFIRASELGGEKPGVIAYYPDDSDVANDAHGEDITVLTLPMRAIVQPRPDEGRLPHLADNWREQVGSLTVEAEAKRRINEGFSHEEQLEAMREELDLVVKHGADASQWPSSAIERKAELDGKWRFVREVRAKARAHVSAMPRDPGSDKLWPKAPAKK